MKYIFLICILLWSLICVDSLAEWMTNEFCATPLQVNFYIMGSMTVASSQKLITVYHNGVALASGDVYKLGESLEVALSDSKESQFIFEIKNAIFSGGGCEGKRIANVETAIISTVETIEGSDITIAAGWSNGYGTVKITPDFVLKAKPELPLQQSFLHTGSNVSRLQQISMVEKDGLSLLANSIKNLSLSLNATSHSISQNKESGRTPQSNLKEKSSDSGDFQNASGNMRGKVPPRLIQKRRGLFANSIHKRTVTDEAISIQAALENYISVPLIGVLIVFVLLVVLYIYYFGRYKVSHALIELISKKTY